jgi:hypothetical protein
VPVIGFLTAVEHEQHGLFGGYLLLNANGRPLEFHCTAPLKPNRAQQILYGPTLEPFLYGEQIGKTLVTKSPLEPTIVLTDLRSMLTVREWIQPPVALVGSRTTGLLSNVADSALAEETAKNTAKFHGLLRFEQGDQVLAVWPDRSADQGGIQACFADLNLTWNLLEPFGRIRGAIEEAQKSMARAA